MGKAGVGALGVVLLAVLIFLAVSSWSRQPAAAAKPSAQPIQFPHNTHVLTYKIDCQYCHADARRSEYAGLPSVQRCLGCHKIVATDKPDIKKLTEYGAKGEPIPWMRVFKLPEYAYFPHKAHVQFGVRCQTCHGPVETMTTVSAQTGPSIANDLLNVAGFRVPPPPLSMGWCVNCHREQNATRNAHAPLDCIACHH